MSLHKSLRARNSLQRRRNVLTRTERILRLTQQETWVEGKDSVFGLPKVKAATGGGGRGKAKEAKPAAEAESGAEAAEGAEETE